MNNLLNFKMFAGLDFSSSLNFDENTFSGEVIMSFVVMFIILVFSIIIGIVYKHKDYKKGSNAFLSMYELLVEKIEGMVEENMGKTYSNYAGYTLCLSLYIFISFLIGVTGLPNPLINMAIPLSLGLITFLLIHYTAIRANKFRYFHRYIEPMAPFLPINLISMWAPLLSITLRLFGNALAGYCLMTIIYFYLGQLSSLIFSFIPEGPNSIFVSFLVTPFLHLYFDLFSGLIQTVVFVTLTQIWIAQEDPDEDRLNRLLAKQQKSIEKTQKIKQEKIKQNM